MTLTPERSVPKVVFTDAEAGAKEFPDSDLAHLQLLHPTEAQADALRGYDRRSAARPAALPLPGLALRLRRRQGRLPARVDGAQVLGSDRPEPKRGPGSGGAGYPWPALGWHEFLAHARGTR